MADGQVTVQAHNFFSPQPVKNADIFLLRYILHDWSNKGAIEILRRLREAAIPGKTKVVVIDGVLEHACKFDRKRIRGAEDIVFEGSDRKSEVPSGLLPNLGRAQARSYCLDLSYGFQLQFLDFSLSDENIGCWPCSMGKSVPWETISR